jgi:hypothetical protein
VRRTSTIKAVNDLVEVRTEDGASTFIKVNKDWTLAQFMQRMLKTMTLYSGEQFRFFATDLEEIRPPWRVLHPRTNALKAAGEVATAGRGLVFGRLNLSPDENLSVDDMSGARLVFHHGVKQFLCYSLPLSTEQAEAAVIEVGSALVVVDQAVFRKKRKGKGGERFNEKVKQLQADLDGNLAGQGVLERYVPAFWLKTCDRGETGKAIMAKAASYSGADATEYILKSRAIQVMQAYFPNLDAYVFGSVKVVKQGEVNWAEVEWENKPPLSLEPPKKPEQELQNAPDAESEHNLLITKRGLELRPPVVGDDNVFLLPLMRGPDRRELNGWCILEGNIVALSLKAWNGTSGSYTQQAVGLRLPEEGSPEAVVALLAALLDPACLFLHG